MELVIPIRVSPRSLLTNLERNLSCIDRGEMRIGERYPRLLRGRLCLACVGVITMFVRALACPHLEHEAISIVDCAWKSARGISEDAAMRSYISLCRQVIPGRKVNNTSPF